MFIYMGRRDPGFIWKIQFRPGSDDLHQIGDYISGDGLKWAQFSTSSAKNLHSPGDFLFISFLNLRQVGAQTWR